MGRKALFYGVVLIGTYLVVSNATGAGRFIGAGASGISTVAKTLQGR